VEHGLDARGELGGVAGLEQQPRIRVLDDLGEPAGGGDHGGGARRHALEGDDPERLVERGDDDAAGSSEQIAQVVRSDGFLGLIPMLMLISLNLGVFNLLPIPLLDGGQIAVLGIEKLMSFFGKTLSMGIKEKIQLAGLAIILLLMVFTLFLDISRFF